MVVVPVGHGVVRGKHFSTNVSRSRRGLVPLGAVAFAPSLSIPPFSSLRTARSTKAPQAEPWRVLGTGSLEFTCSFSRWVGGWQVGRFGSCWSMQTATRNVHALSPHTPSVSHGSPSTQLTTRPPLTFDPWLSTPWTFNSTRQSDLARSVPLPGISPASTGAVVVVDVLAGVVVVDVVDAVVDVVTSVVEVVDADVVVVLEVVVVCTVEVVVEVLVEEVVVVGWTVVVVLVELVVVVVGGLVVVVLVEVVVVVVVGVVVVGVVGGGAVVVGVVELVVVVVGGPVVVVLVELVVVEVVVVTGQSTQQGMLESCWIVGGGVIVAPVVTGAGGWRYARMFWSPAFSVPAIVMVEPAWTMLTPAPGVPATGPVDDSSPLDSMFTVHPERKMFPASWVESTMS